jgi:hypothetical protein
MMVIQEIFAACHKNQYARRKNARKKGYDAFFRQAILLIIGSTLLAQ